MDDVLREGVAKVNWKSPKLLDSSAHPGLTQADSPEGVQSRVTYRWVAYRPGLKGLNNPAQGKWVTAVTRHRLRRGRTPPWERISPAV